MRVLFTVLLVGFAVLAGVLGSAALGRVNASTEPEATVAGPHLASSWVRGAITGRLCIGTQIMSAEFESDDRIWRVRARQGQLAPGIWLVDDRLGAAVPWDDAARRAEVACERSLSSNGSSALDDIRFELQTQTHILRDIEYWVGR